jgi:hypothetical protein
MRIDLSKELKEYKEKVKTADIIRKNLELELSAIAVLAQHAVRDFNEGTPDKDAAGAYLVEKIQAIAEAYR